MLYRLTERLLKWCSDYGDLFMKYPNGAIGCIVFAVLAMVVCLLGSILVPVFFMAR